jgi:hypothetical protein
MARWKRTYKAKSLDTLKLLEEPILAWSGKELYSQFEQLLQNAVLLETDLAINGNDLIKLGIKGKQIGTTLAYLLSLFYESNPEIQNNGKDLIEIVRGQTETEK